jgi:hypothetical protein
MEKPHRVIQVYGYTVCVVAIIAFLIAANEMVHALINLGDPLHAGSMYTMGQAPSLASFENYKLDVLKMQKKGEDIFAPSYMPDDQTLRGMYDAAKEERIISVRLANVRSLIGSGMTILVSVILFLTHWFWMRKVLRAAA